MFHLVYLVFPKSLSSIANLLVLCYLTQRLGDIRFAWVFYLACLHSHVLRAYYNFESKREISITLFGRRPNKKTYVNSNW